MINESEKNYQKAIKFFEKMHYAKGKATVLALKARVYNRIGQYEKSNTISKIALQYSLQHGFFDFVWRIQALRAETLAKLGKHQEAEQRYREATNTINSLTSSLITESAKRKFGFNKDDIALNLIKYDIRNKNYEQLFIDAEENRARAFIDTLSSRTINHKNPILKEIYNIDKEINKLSILNMKIGINNSNGVKKIQALIREKVEKEKALKLDNPKLSSIISVWSNSLKETQNNLGENTLIYFMPLKQSENITYLYISNSTYSFHTLNITYAELKDNLQELSKLLGINSIQTRAVKVVSTSRTIKQSKSITQLRKKLTKIFRMNVKSKNSFIVASGDTNFIPWGMLDINFTPLLIPTASWINLKHISFNSKKAVIIGNPNFGGDAIQLQGAEEEAKSLAKLYKQKALLNASATKANIRKAIGEGSNVLHFATHGIFYKNHPLKSSLLLTDGEKATKLTANEIFKQPLKSNLVVLSACESGLGSNASANDYLGLSRSFFLGGSKAVLSSLWAIEDEGTKEFMKVFHRYAKEGKYALGYKMAREHLKSKGYSPTIYGAFILQGLGEK